MALAPIGQEVQEFSKRLGLSAELAILEHAWNRELGHLSSDARIVALHASALVVEVNSHVVMQEVSLRRRELVRKINRHFPAPMIEQISLRMGSNDGH